MLKVLIVLAIKYKGSKIVLRTKGSCTQGRSHDLISGGKMQQEGRRVSFLQRATAINSNY